MIIRLTLAFVTYALAIAYAAGGRHGTSSRGRGGRTLYPVATSVFGGAIPGKEPHLLEFHGTNCEHCEVREVGIGYEQDNSNSLCNIPIALILPHWFGVLAC